MITDEQRNTAKRLVAEKKLQILSTDLLADIERAARSGDERDLEAVAQKISDAESVNAEVSAFAAEATFLSLKR